MDRKRRHRHTAKRRQEQSRRKRSAQEPGSRKVNVQEQSKRKVNAQGQSRQKRRQKKAAFDVLSGAVLIIAVCVFVFSLYQLVLALAPYFAGGKEYSEIKELAITADEDGSGFRIDFDALSAENPDTVAWIRFDEPSVISYPVVKGSDNEEYLTKTFSASDNKLGAIFMNVDNNADLSDRNTIIYGHHLNTGGEMFSELLKYEDESFCRENPYFYIYTPDGSVRTYTIFAAGVVKDTAEQYTVGFASDETFANYIEVCRGGSAYPVDVQVDAQSKIVTLSTCTNVRDDERFIVQGVLTATD